MLVILTDTVIYLISVYNRIGVLQLLTVTAGIKPYIKYGSSKFKVSRASIPLIHGSGGLHSY